MPDIEKEICTWLHQQQDWIQEAVEKLLASNNLADSDIQAITELLKTTVGQQITTHRKFDGLRTTSTSSTEVHLLEIGEICGIENLCPQSPLTFGTGNLAVIYGPNGSGKSGYIRILKRACGNPMQRRSSSMCLKVGLQSSNVRFSTVWLEARSWLHGRQTTLRYRTSAP